MALPAADARIETARLVLRKSRREDWRDLYENVWSRPEAARYMFWSVTTDEDGARARMERTLDWERTHPYKYSVEEKRSGRVIGWAGVEPLGDGVWSETGIALGPAFWRRGYGREILETLCAFCREELGARRFLAWTRETNAASRALIERCGFVPERSETRLGEDGAEFTLLVYRKDLT